MGPSCHPSLRGSCGEHFATHDLILGSYRRPDGHRVRSYRLLHGYRRPGNAPRGRRMRDRLQRFLWL